MDFKDLTPEQKAKARACETAEDLVSLAKLEGITLSDEQLDAMSGGSWNSGCTGYTCDENYNS